MTAPKIDPIHEVARSLGLILGEIIELGNDTALIFMSDPRKNEWAYYLRVRLVNGRFMISEASGIHPDYRDARVAAWEAIIVPRKIVASYQERVGYAWDKLVAEPPQSIKIG